MEVSVIRRVLPIVLAFAAGGVYQARAQETYQIHHQIPTAVERGSNTLFTFSVPGIDPEDISDAYLFHRTEGESAYRQKPATLNGSTFEVPVEITNSSAASLNYYFEITFTEGGSLSYPGGMDGVGLVSLNIIDKTDTAQSASGSENSIGYTILSPEPGENVHPDDLVIAITLFYGEETVDTTRSAFQLELDGRDITDHSRAGAYFYTYAPEDLAPGQHNVALKLVEEDRTRTIAFWPFTVADRETARPAFEDGKEDRFTPTGRLELTARNQVIGGNGSDLLDGNMRLYGSKDNMRYSAYGLMTSQEDPRLQPQNRYGGELYVGDWFALQAGHIYPMLSPMTIAGRRIEGVNSELNLLEGSLNLQFLHGNMRRGISNLYGPVVARPVRSDEAIVDTTYSLGFRERGFGAYRQKVTGGRIGYERGDHFQLGLNVLKVQDDTASMNVVRSFNGLMQHNPELAADLSAAERNDLETNPGLLNVASGPSPKGNVVAETDLEINLHDKRIRLQADAAVSMVNNNINGGALTSERAEEMGFILNEDDENLLKRLSWLIIINEYTDATPFRFDVEDGRIAADIRIPKGIWATESELSLNYFKNSLRIQYRRIGPDFESFANSAIPQDVAGFTVTDRFRLFDDQVYVTLGYENLDDNVIGSKETTINTSTIRSNVSWYPLQSGLPSLSLGLNKRSRKNGVGLNNPYLTPSLETSAVLNYRLEDGELVSTRMPLLRNSYQATASIYQQVEFWGVTHDVSLNYSLFRSDEALYAYGDERSRNLSLTVSNRFSSLPLDTNFGFNYNTTDIGGGLNDIRITGVNVGGSLFLLDDKLNLDASVALTRSSSAYISLGIDENNTPGDYTDDYYTPDRGSVSESESNSYIFSAEARYDVNKHHAFSVSGRFTNVVSKYRGEEIPNDRILQARYIFSF